MSTIDDLKLTETNMIKKVNGRRQEVDELRAEGERLKKEAELRFQEAKEAEKHIIFMMAELGAMRKNAQAAAAAEKRFQEQA